VKTSSFRGDAKKIIPPTEGELPSILPKSENTDSRMPPKKRSGTKKKKKTSPPSRRGNNSNASRKKNQRSSSITAAASNLGLISTGLHSTDFSDSEESGHFHSRQHLRLPARTNKAISSEILTSQSDQLTLLPSCTPRQRSCRGVSFGSDFTPSNDVALSHGTTDLYQGCGGDDEIRSCGPPPLTVHKLEGSSDEDSSDDNDVPDLMSPGNVESRYVEASNIEGRIHSWFSI
jgi:hypothetical protein